MILAGIDIGTNSLRLLVADVGPDSFREILSVRKVTRLGQDLDGTGKLSHDAEKRSLSVLLDFKEYIRHHAAVHIAALGTSALRNASNSAEFIGEVNKRTGLDIGIITGEEEARLMLLGVAEALKGPGARQGDPLASTLVIDIGGGSTEIIITRSGRAPLVASLPLGAVYLTERFIKHDPPSASELEQLRDTVKNVLARHGDRMKPDSAGVLVGTAGTITTLAAMNQGLAEYEPDKINRCTMAGETIDGIVENLAVSTLAERRTIPGLEKGREDIILAGAVVTQEIMKQFGFSTMIVSDGGLREGIVLDLYERHGKDKHQMTHESPISKYK